MYDLLLSFALQRMCSVPANLILLVLHPIKGQSIVVATLSREVNTCLVCTLCKSYLVCAYTPLFILYTLYYYASVFRVTITTGVLAALLSVTPSLSQWAISTCLVCALCRGRRSSRCLCSRRWFCCSSTLQTNLCSRTSEKPLVSVGGEYTIHVFCLEYRVSWVRIPPETAHFSLEKLHFVRHFLCIHDVV